METVIESLRCNLKPDVCANVHSAAIACMDGGGGGCAKLTVGKH